LISDGWLPGVLAKQR